MKILGINGLGRIGKMSLWHHVARRHYDRIVVNLGRKAGKSLGDLAKYIGNDSTYGTLHNYIDGVNGKFSIEVVSEEAGEMLIHGIPVKILREQRNPRLIPWREEGVDIVVETTGVFADPQKPEDDPKGSLRGHLAAGAKFVILSSAFKVKPNGMPDDSKFLIYGINHYEFRSTQHKIISAASCTTTALAHMMQPLLNDERTMRLVTAGMSTIHATTKSQSILDDVPGADEKDLRRNRSLNDNIIITTTNAAKALEWVLPQIKGIGFMADSVRVPVSTVSLIILNCTFQSEIDGNGDSIITRDIINGIYQYTQDTSLPNLVEYSDSQNVSIDVKGRNVAVVIEGVETHTRTGFMRLMMPCGTSKDEFTDVPVTHAKIFGWYDNELGSYSNRLGDLTVYLGENY